MIYWEHQNPRFDISLRNPREIGYDIYRWSGVGGWIDYLDADSLELEFSSPLSVERVCLDLRILCVGSVSHPHHLVIYYYEQEEVCLSLIGSPDERLFEGFGTVAPEWWSVEEGLTSMQRLLERIKVLHETVTQHHRTNRYRYPSHLETHVEKFCARCGLLLEFHVSHVVPGFEGKLTFSTAEEARPYMTAFKQHYGGALKKMSNDDLLKMPLPPNKRNLRVLLLEVQSRIEHPKSPASALDRMLAGGLLDE